MQGLRILNIVLVGIVGDVLSSSSGYRFCNPYNPNCINHLLFLLHLRIHHGYQNLSILTR